MKRIQSYIKVPFGKYLCIMHICKQDKFAIEIINSKLETPLLLFFFFKATFGEEEIIAATSEKPSKSTESYWHG